MNALINTHHELIDLVSWIKISEIAYFWKYFKKVSLVIL